MMGGCSSVGPGSAKDQGLSLHRRPLCWWPLLEAVTKILNKSSLRKEGLVLAHSLRWQNPSWLGGRGGGSSHSCGGRNVRQLALVSRVRREVNAGAAWLFCQNQSGTPAHGMPLPTSEMGASHCVSTLLDTLSQTHSGVFPGQFWTQSSGQWRPTIKTIYQQTRPAGTGNPKLCRKLGT